MLTLRNYSVSIGEKQILKNLDLSFPSGQTHILLGKNGSGKSSLAFSLMGHPRYQVSGDLFFDEENITTTSPDIRSHRGIFLSFQSIPEIPGVTLFEYLRTIYNTHKKVTHPEEKPTTSLLFRRIITKLSDDLGIDPSFFDRDLYVGFSGGEKRRVELLQIRLLDPQVIILDEIDSGLDIGAIEILAREIDHLREKGKTIIIITHNFSLLDTIAIDQVVLFQSGRVEKVGGREIIGHLREYGIEK